VDVEEWRGVPATIRKIVRKEYMEGTAGRNAELYRVATYLRERGEPQLSISTGVPPDNLKVDIDMVGYSPGYYVIKEEVDPDRGEQVGEHSVQPAPAPGTRKVRRQGG